MPANLATSDYSFEESACHRPDTLVDRPDAGERPPWDVEKRIGTLVAGAWRLVRVLGQGASATVYEARHETRNIRGAVKLLTDTKNAPREAQIRFMREGRTAASIRHPNIVRVLDVGRNSDGTLYQVQEFLEGDDLASLMARGPLSLRDALAITSQLLLALDVVHNRGLIHRDIKPENIFISRVSGVPAVKLLDFGIAKHVGRRALQLTQDGIVLGTPEYMSPEQILGHPLTAQSDLWSTGVVLFHMLAGAPPFHGKSIHALLTRIATEQVPSLMCYRPDLPSVLVHAVDHALKRNPKGRWASAEEMATALAAARPFA